MNWKCPASDSEFLMFWRVELSRYSPKVVWLLSEIRCWKCRALKMHLEIRFKVPDCWVLTFCFSKGCFFLMAFVSQHPFLKLLPNPVKTEIPKNHIKFKFETLLFHEVAVTFTSIFASENSFAIIILSFSENCTIIRIERIESQVLLQFDRNWWLPFSFRLKK